MTKNAGWELSREVEIAEKALELFCPGTTDPDKCENCGSCVEVFKLKEKEFFQKLEQPRLSLRVDLLLKKAS